MKKVTCQFLDRPMKPIDLAVWWVEYTLRHDTSFLRSSTVDQSWWVKRQLDVWLFIMFTLFGFNMTIVYLLYKLLQKCKSKENKSLMRSKQKQS